MKFTRTEAEEKEDRDEDVTGVFTVTQRPSFLLNGGQALITFEEENGENQTLLNNIFCCIFGFICTYQ